MSHPRIMPHKQSALTQSVRGFQKCFPKMNFALIPHHGFHPTEPILLGLSSY